MTPMLFPVAETRRISMVAEIRVSEEMYLSNGEFGHAPLYLFP